MQTRMMLACLSLVGCAHYTPMTKAEVADYGMRRYAGVDRDRATDRCAEALATLGYKITVKDSQAGLVKTAPRVISTTAVGGAGYANVTEDGFAWSVIIRQEGADVVLRATPRGFRNGSELHGENMWVREILEPKFRDLWGEMDATLISH